MRRGRRSAGPAGAGDADERELLAEVRAVYQELEARSVERDCQLRGDCCRFRLTGRTPQVTAGEARVALAALRASGRKQWRSRADGACPLLSATGTCTIYEGRPFGCRTHFCDAAGGPYTRRDVIDLIRRLEQVDRRLGGEGPRSFEAALVAVPR